MKKNKIRFLLLIGFVLLLTGCWDRKEVNDLAIITIAGIDKKDDERLELTVLIYVPKGGGGQQMDGGSSSGGGEQLVRSAEGVTMADAMSKLQQKFPRRLFWAHTEVILIDEELAKGDIRPRFDFILRHPQLRERAHIFVSKQKVKELLSIQPPLERDLAEVLHELALLKIGIDVTTKELAQMLISDGGAAAVPYIEKLPPQSGQKEKETIAYITGSAVFKNGKMVGYIDEKVTRGVLWLRNEIELSIVTVKPDNAEGHISMNLLRADSKLIPKIENGIWKITLKTETEDDIIQNATNLELKDKKNIVMLEQKLIEEINERVNLTLEVVQKGMEADIFGFADAFHRAYPDIWNKNKNQWNDIFPNVEVTIETKANVRRPGMVTKPALIPEDEVRTE